MDWLRLFALLIAVASVTVTAEGSKKKIRIHLPQKVKHIHHHKKIYITNHPAPSQYAPAYLPSAEGAVAVPTNVALPAVANIVPLNSVELYDDSQPRLPGLKPAASKVLPLYRARGYYGPTPNEWDEPEYDSGLTHENTDNSYTPAVHPPPPVLTPTSNHIPKRVKVIKVNDQPRKKVLKKPKQKRVPIRSQSPSEEEHPVTNFHEQFYSDLDGSGTIRKIKKPQRVEKIIDGDTEHIHTYSEEHIHKLVFDDGPKTSGLAGVDQLNSMSAISAANPLFQSIKNGQLIAIPSEPLTGFTAIGSLGTPSHLEYASYNPRDVTHDHIFHDHGEIPPEVDITKETLGFPPRASYTSHGVRINGGFGNKRYKNKHSHKYPKATKSTPVNDLSYYESIYTPYNGFKSPQKALVSQYDTAGEPAVENYRPIPSFKFFSKNPNKIRSTYGNNVQQTNVPAPYSVSSTIVHDYQPKSYPGALPPSGFSKFKDPFVNFKDSYSNNYEYDTYASSSNVFTSEDKNDNSLVAVQNLKGKKSISTQNISFGGQEPKTMVVDHLEDSNISSELHDDTPSAFDNLSSYDHTDLTQVSDATSPTAYTIRESSPAHPYYTAMAIKALHTGQAPEPEASNDNYQYAEAPSQSTTPYTTSIATTTSAPLAYFENQSTSTITTELPRLVSENEHAPRHKHKKNMSNKKTRQKYIVINELDKMTEFNNGDSQSQARKQLHHNHQISEDSGVRGKFKYGDKL
ncbi:uncharacterized protein LOC113517507 [Galleria mellonella]|uniref:Uncharacterized protein LOC113517507 n=1 Tax=Galleria mellonella TaxID=7137 RepID=A0A6J1WR70_GALME|nr:uncharacterized protein LOC113517507 [Galleria mellonella]